MYEVPTGEQHLLDALVVDRLAMRRLHAEEPPVALDRASRSSTAIPTWSICVELTRAFASPRPRGGCIRATSSIASVTWYAGSVERPRHRRHALRPQVLLGLRAVAARASST